MSYLLNEDFVGADIQTRVTLLLKHNIALYDSVEECDIEGSSDTKIKNVVPANIPSFLAAADIKHIFCNGTASYNYFTRFYPEYKTITAKLPSTSPANAKYSIPTLADEWKDILSYI